MILKFIRKLLAPRPSPERKAKSGPKPRRFVEIVGESRYQDVLSEIAGGKTYDGHVLPVRARLVPKTATRSTRWPSASRSRAGGSAI